MYVEGQRLLDVATRLIRNPMTFCGQFEDHQILFSEHHSVTETRERARERERERESREREREKKERARE